MDRIKQGGAAMVEFIVTAPVLLGLGLGTVQAGLVYHGNTVLNYATFETARTGAVNHALLAPMMDELGARLAPLEGGDGSAGKAGEAITRSRLAALAQQDVFTHIEILNPSLEAFNHFKVSSRESGQNVIPNSHLRHQPEDDVDPVSGVNIQDANLLKIRVTHGFDLKVPGIRQLVGTVMSRIDPQHTHYYMAGKLPLVSVATVRMQSEVHEESLRSVNAPPASSRTPTDPDSLDDQETVVADTANTPQADESTLEAGESGTGSNDASRCGGIFGPDPALPVAHSQSCAVDSSAQTQSSPIVTNETSDEATAC